MKNIDLGFILVIIGSIIGAGFASGKEIEVFFSGAGAFSLLIIIIASIFFYFSIKNLIKFTKITQKSNMKEINKILFNKTSKFFDSFIFVGLFIFLVVLLAGLNSIGTLIFSNINFPIITILSIFFSFFIVLNGIEMMTKVNIILMPIIIISILVVAISSFFSINSSNFFSFNQNLNVKYIFSGFLYVGYNIIFLSSLVAQKSINFSHKKSKINTIFLSVLLFILLFVVNGVMMKIKFSTDLPMLILAFKINSIVGYIFTLVLYFSILTSLISTLYVLTNSIKMNKFFSIAIFSTLAYIFSFFGLDFIVSFIYPIEGVVGIIFILKVYFYNKKHTKML